MSHVKVAKLILMLMVSASAMLVAGCGSSSGGGGNSNALPGPVGERLMGRYQPLGDDQAIVLDTITGLAWQRCSLGQTWSNRNQRCTGTLTLLDWPAAAAFESDDGFSLPTFDELATLVFCSNEQDQPEEIGTADLNDGCSGGISPTILPNVFPDTEQRTYWTLDASPGSPNLRLGVNFTSGFISDNNAQRTRYAIRLVRDASDLVESNAPETAE